MALEQARLALRHGPFNTAPRARGRTAPPGGRRTRRHWRGLAPALLALSLLLALLGAGASSAQVNTSNRTPVSGDVRAWGWNGYGQLGNGGLPDSSAAVEVTGLSGVTAISSGYFHGLALKSDSSVWAWGNNYGGEIGDGTKGPGERKYTPVQVKDPTAAKFLTGVVAVATGMNDSLALMRDGHVFAWGYNYDGELGNGTSGSGTDSPLPVQVLTDATTPLSNVVAIAGGGRHFLALTSNGDVYAWGKNSDGQLGADSTTFPLSAFAIRITSLSGITAIAAGGYHSLALKSDGSAWAWGYNGNGQLGDGVSPPSSHFTPSQVSFPPNTVISALAGGEYHSLALQNDGTAWAWGGNGTGQLGNGSTSDSVSPARVVTDQAGAALSGIAAVAAGANHSLALSSTGTVYAWGDNNHRQLGNGATCDPSKTYNCYDTYPRLLTDVSNISAISGGYGHSLAITTPVVSLTPTSLSFANPQIIKTTSGEQTVTLSNTGQGTLFIGSISTTSAEFAQTNLCPASLTPGASCAIKVTFTPTAAGSRSGTLTVADNAPGNSHIVSLSGTGKYPPPTVNNINPTSGRAAGGDSVTISGANFRSGALVTFGASGSTAPCAPVAVAVDGKSLTCTTTGHAAGKVDVTVNNDDQQASTLANAFTYLDPAPAVSSGAPDRGPIAGNQSVTFSGGPFQSGATVSLGGSACAVTATTSSTITCTTSSHGAGSVDVVVTNPYSYAGKSPNGYTYVAPPTVSGLNPASAQAGSAAFTLTVNGSDFDAGAKVRWNGVDRPTTFVNATQLTATIPASDLTAPGTAEVTVVTAGGTSSPRGFFVTQTSAPVTGSDSASSTTPGGTATASAGPASATASGGTGTVTVAQYGSNPAVTPPPGGSGAYLDVYLSRGATFTEVTIVSCQLNGATQLSWWTGSAWVLASNQTYDAARGCVTVTVTAATSPSLAQLTGTVLAGIVPAAVPPPPPAPAPPAPAPPAPPPAPAPVIGPGMNYSGWQPLPSRLAGYAPAIGTFQSQLLVVMVGTGNQLYLTRSADGVAFGDWQPLGGQATSAPALAVHNGQLSIFARGSDNALYVSQSGDGVTFTPWRSLGGVLTGAPAATSFNGQLLVYAAGRDGALYVSSSATGGNFSAWQSLGGRLDRQGLDPIAVVANQGRLFVYARGNDDALYMLSSPDGVAYTPWSSLGGVLTSGPAAASAGNTMAVFVRGADGRLYETRTTDGGATFSSWRDLGGVLATAPAASSFQNQFYLATGGVDRQVYLQSSQP